MLQRICRKPLEYGGRKVSAGERFDVEPQHTTMLLAAGHIEREDGDAVPGYVPRDMAATWPHGYQTRDIAAERPRRGTLTRKAS